MNPPLTHLYRYLVENGSIVSICEFRPEELHLTPGDVLAAIRAGDPNWEKLVPPEAAAVIKQKGLFGYRSTVAGG